MASPYPKDFRPAPTPQDIHGWKGPPKPANDNWRLPKPANDNVPGGPRPPKGWHKFGKAALRGLSIYGRTDIMRDAIDRFATVVEEQIELLEFQEPRTREFVIPPQTLHDGGWKFESYCRSGLGFNSKTYNNYCGPIFGELEGPGLFIPSFNGAGSWARRKSWYTRAPSNTSWQHLRTYIINEPSFYHTEQEVIDAPQPYLRAFNSPPWPLPTLNLGWLPSIEPMLLPIGSPAAMPDPLPWHLTPHKPWANPMGEPLKGPRPQPRPKPQPKPEGDIVVHPISPPGKQTPPGKGTKETKVRIKFGQQTLGVVGQITEGFDLMMCFHKALPMKYRAKPKRRGDKSWRAPTAFETIAAIYQHWDKLDIPKLIECLIVNQVEDAIIGTIGSKVKKAPIQPNGPFGWTTGPAL